MRETLIGGQALIEGVMMKGPDKIGIAVRAPDKSIKTESFPFVSLTKRYKILSLPFIRGIVSIGEMMVIGMKALQISSKYAYPDDEQGSGGWLDTVITVSVITFSLLLALFLFKFVPLGAAELVHRIMPLHTVAYNLIEGVVKLAVFMGYIVAITFLPDIFRVWQYHGAEHKVVRCYEEKSRMSPKAAKKCSRLHPRCGTSFVIFVIVLSILLYIWLPTDWPFWLKLTARLALLPVLAGISFELLRIVSRNPKSMIFKIISAPGMATQLLTTREPDLEQLEVAIVALNLSLDK